MDKRKGGDSPLETHKKKPKPEESNGFHKQEPKPPEDLEEIHGSELYR